MKVVDDDDADMMLMGRAGTVTSRTARDPSRWGPDSRRKRRRSGEGLQNWPQKARLSKEVGAKLAV